LLHYTDLNEEPGVRLFWATV